MQFHATAGLGRVSQPEGFRLFARACYALLSALRLLRSRRSQVRILWGAPRRGTVHLRKESERFSQFISNTFAIEHWVRKYDLEEATLLVSRSLSCARDGWLMCLGAGRSMAFAAAEGGRAA